MAAATLVGNKVSDHRGHHLHQRASTHLATTIASHLLRKETMAIVETFVHHPQQFEPTAPPLTTRAPLCHHGSANQRLSPLHLFATPSSLHAPVPAVAPILNLHLHGSTIVVSIFARVPLCQHLQRTTAAAASNTTTELLPLTHQIEHVVAEKKKQNAAMFSIHTSHCSVEYEPPCVSAATLTKNETTMPEQPPLQQPQASMKPFYSQCVRENLVWREKVQFATCQFLNGQSNGQTVNSGQRLIKQEGFIYKY